jgi:hypothetical protein
MKPFLGAVILLVAFLPTLIAYRRDHRNSRAIILLNFLSVCPYLAILFGKHNLFGKQADALFTSISNASPEAESVIALINLLAFPALLLAFFGWLVSIVWSATEAGEGGK